MSSPSTSSWAKWTFWTLVAFAAFIFVAVFTGRVASSHTSYDDQEAAKRKETLRKLKEEEATTMSTPDWVDKTKQIVRLPLNDAFGPALAALQAKTPHMAEVIPGTVPPPTPTPAPTPTAALVPSPTPAPTPSSHPTPAAKSPKPSSKPSPAPTKAAHKP